MGASIIGDLYGNFGWFSLIMAIIFGAITSKIFKFGNNEENRLYCAKYYSLFYILINLVRASFFEIFRPAFMVYFVPILIMWLLEKSNKAKHKNMNK
ncbi:hypothetical protein MASR2M70_03400 [Bacillota bacterium]